MLPPRRAKPHIQGHDPDAAIRATDTDASQARMSAVRKQYLCDPFIASLVPRPHLVPARPPLINVGTYVRSEAIDELVLEWLKFASAEGQKVQIVSLGAGSDTRFWRLATGPLNQSGRLQELLARYLELDFAENTSLKVRAIQQKKELGSVVGDFTVSGPSLTSSIYAIRDVDLRRFQTVLPGLLTSSAATDEAMSSHQGLLDPMLPTLFLAECVLVYMDQTQSDALIQWFSNTFTVAGAIVYEMFGLNDSFGKVMKENLRTRNVSLPGVDAYPTLDAQSQRFINSGFTSARSLTLRKIRNQYIHPVELGRIAMLELLDEIEELELVLDHYVISWAIKNSIPSCDDQEAAPEPWGLRLKVDDSGAMPRAWKTQPELYATRP